MEGKKEEGMGVFMMYLKGIVNFQMRLKVLLICFQRCLLVNACIQLITATLISANSTTKDLHSNSKTSKQLSFHSPIISQKNNSNSWLSWKIKPQQKPSKRRPHLYFVRWIHSTHRLKVGTTSISQRRHRAHSQALRWTSGMKQSTSKRI